MILKCGVGSEQADFAFLFNRMRIDYFLPQICLIHKTDTKDGDRILQKENLVKLG